MSNKKEYRDTIAFHPGYYVADIIDDMGISQAEFASRMGTNTKTLSNLVNGKANITNDLAKKLSVMMGTSSELWLNLQKAYDEKLIDIQKQQDFDEQKSIVKQIDYQYFVKNADLPATRKIEEKIANLCEFFKIYDLRVLLKPDFYVNYRTGVSQVDEKNTINSNAWIQTALSIAMKNQTNEFNAAILKSHINELRSMTVQKPAVFLPRMREIFEKSGVSFVLLPHLRNSGINGAVKWINDKRVVLAINDRRQYADTFWFSLFHEIKHVLQQKITATFISGNINDLVEYNDALEEDADKYAADILIPQAKLDAFNASEYTTDQEIIDFAKSIGIHPGIVAGRLQHEKIIPQNRCTTLKEKYIIISN